MSRISHPKYQPELTGSCSINLFPYFNCLLLNIMYNAGFYLFKQKAKFIMHKIAIINTRIEPKLKQEAEHILHKTGLTSAEAIRLFYRQVCLRKGLPFEIKIPNKTTLKAMRDAREGKLITVKKIDRLLDSLNANN